ncbi:MAG: hypothetical protein AB7S92_07250 [Parvibaculaceae bacterium]
MIIVIQCAGKKQPNAGMMKTSDGRPVYFVGDPDRAPDDGMQYAHPEDISDTGEPWRDRVWAYNQTEPTNPLGLLPAYKLYGASAYGELVRHFGVDKVYILSAGWGLISATFLTPLYDITFLGQADAWKRRRNSDCYNDFCMLPSNVTEPIVFLGGKDYVLLFGKLTQTIDAPKTIFYRSASKPDLAHCHAVKFHTIRSTNWHYECAAALIRGSILI